MTVGTLTATAVSRVLGAAPPLEPDRELARSWARHELSDPAYAKARPGLLQRLVGWVLDRIDDIQLRSASLPSAHVGLALLVLVLAGVVVVVLVRTGRLRGPGRVKGGAAVFDDLTRTADEHRRLADQAAAAGAWEVAVRERFRAVVRSLEERTVLDERPGRTAHEAADEAAAVLPGTLDPLRDGARVFEDVWYGGRAASPQQDAGLRELDQLLGRTRPLWDGAGAQGAGVEGAGVEGAGVEVANQ